MFRLVPLGGRLLASARPPSRAAAALSSAASHHHGDGSKPQLPSGAQVVICGGGVVGCSVAYHLAEMGWKDVVLLEQGNLACGTTWHAAGLITRHKFYSIESAFTSYSADLYKKLETEGYHTGWKNCGSLNLAQTRNRVIAYRRALINAKQHGVEGEFLTPEQISERWPLIKTDDLEGGFWIPGDGSANPTDIVAALTKKAKENGVKIFEGVKVEQVQTKHCKVRGVQTDHGYVDCQYFVNCGGQWARELGQVCEPPVRVPLHSCEHFYLVTKAIPGIDHMMPVVRDYDSGVYFREWSGGILGGGFEKKAKPIFHDGIPNKFEYQLLPEDWDHFQELLDPLLHRIPILAEGEVRQLVNGPESFTPDGKSIIGESPEVDNYFVAAGMNSTGIASAGGVGKYLAEWIVEGEPSIDMWSHDVRRFVDMHNNKKFLRARVSETVDEFLGTDTPHGHGTFGKPEWFDSVKSEYWACREGVCLIDMSTFSKFELRSYGREVIDFLQIMCSNDMDKPVGQVIHTGMQNENGGYENDCSLVRLSENSYFMISPTAQQTRGYSWLKHHLPIDGSVQLSDVTSMYTAINVIGPRAQDLLSELTDTPLTKQDFFSMTCKEIDVGQASGVKAMRLTHSGEDGWMLYIPSEYALHVYDSLMTAGKNYGIRNAGYYALRALRTEKFFAYWGTDLNPRTTPMECGREYRVKFGSGNFIGHAALLKQREEGIKKKLVQFLLEDHNMEEDVWPWGGEPIYRNGKYVGHTTSTAYGFTLDRHICLGYVADVDDSTGEANHITNDYVLKDAKFEIDIAGKRFAAKAGIYPPKLASAEIVINSPNMG